MRPIVADRIAWSVSQSVTTVSPAKTAESIRMSFRMWTRVGPRNYVLTGGPDLACKRAILRGIGAVHCKVYGLSAVSYARTAEPKIEMPFGMWTRVDLRNHVLDGVHIGAAW